MTDAKRHAAKRDAQEVSLEDFPNAEEFKRFAKTDHLQQSIELDPDEENQVDPSSRDQFKDDSTVGFH